MCILGDLAPQLMEWVHDIIIVYETVQIVINLVDALFEIDMMNISVLQMHF